MANDSAQPRTTLISQRRIQRSSIRRAACLLTIAIGIPSPTTISVPTLTYTQTLVAPAVQVSGGQSVTLPTIAYVDTLVAPSVVSSSSPPDITSRFVTRRIAQQRVQRCGVSKSAINTIVLGVGVGNFVQLPTLGYVETLVTPYVIANPALIYLSSDDGKWFPRDQYVKRPNKGLMLILESGNQNLALPTLSYTYTLITPAAQVSGSQSVTLPTLDYVVTLIPPQIPQALVLPTLDYSITLTGLAVVADPIDQRCTVVAFRRGYFDGRIKEVGERFAIHTPYEFTPYWMTFIDAIPSTWVPFLEVFSPEIDRRIARPLTATDVTNILAQDPGPYET